MLDSIPSSALTANGALRIPVVLVCALALALTACADHMSRVVFLEGHMTAWKRDGLPVEVDEQGVDDIAIADPSPAH